MENIVILWIQYTHFTLCKEPADETEFHIDKKYLWRGKLRLGKNHIARETKANGSAPGELFTVKLSFHFNNPHFQNLDLNSLDLIFIEYFTSNNHICNKASRYSYELRLKLTFTQSFLMTKTYISSVTYKDELDFPGNL